MEKKDYIAPIADIVELSTDIVLSSDDEGWGDMIPFNSYKPGDDKNSSPSRW